MISVKIAPRSRQVIAEVKLLSQKHKTGLEAALRDILPDVMRETKRLIKHTRKTGRTYPFRGGLHRASAPGEAPASRTGRLLRSTNYGVRNWQEGYIGEKVPHALFMEKGTRTSSRHTGIAPRPHLIAAINNMAGKTYLRLSQAGL